MPFGVSGLIEFIGFDMLGGWDAWKLGGCYQLIAYSHDDQDVGRIGGLKADRLISDLRQTCNGFYNLMIMAG